MGESITLATIGAVASMVLDGVWLGRQMKNHQLFDAAPMPLARTLVDVGWGALPSAAAARAARVVAR